MAAFCGRDPVGWAVSWPDEFGPPGCRHVSTFVAPGWRRRGIGRRLIRILERSGRLCSSYEDEAGKAFYRSVGIPSDWFPNSDWLICFHPNLLPGPGELPGLPA